MRRPKRPGEVRAALDSVLQDALAAAELGALSGGALGVVSIKDQIKTKQRK